MQKWLLRHGELRGSEVTDTAQHSGPRRLTDALERGEFSLLYQAEFDVTTASFVGVEALVRRRLSGGGFEGPAAFLSEFRAEHALDALARWTLQLACEQGAEWHAMGYRFSVGVNCTDEQLLSTGFIDDVVDALDTNRFPAKHLAIECHYDPATFEALTPVLRDLHDVGVTLVLDHALLESALFDLIATLPLDVVKLDRSIVGALSSSSTPQSSAALETLRETGIRIVASGVELPEHRQLVRTLPVDTEQGFLLARPSTVEELNDYLEDFSLFSGRPL